MSVKNWFKFLALGLIWGSSFLWIKIALRETGPFTLVFFRVFFATLGLVALFIIIRKRFLLKFWWVYLVLGIFNVALPFVLISWSEKHISSGMASILNSTVPLFTILVAAIFLKEERFTLPRVFGLLLGFGGVIVLMSNRLEGGTSMQAVGIATMLIAAFSYGLSAVFARKANKGLDAESQSLGQMAGALIFMLPSMLIFEAPFQLPHLPITYAALGWLGLLGSCVAAILWFSLINEIGPTRTSMVTYMFPLVGVILGVIVLNESVDWRLLVGGLLVLCAIIIVNHKKKGLPASLNIPAEAMEGIDNE